MIVALVLMYLALTACVPGPSEREVGPAELAASGVEKVDPELARLVPEQMARARVPGLQLALIRDGRVIAEERFGATGNPDGRAVNADTVFEAASLTKPVFANVVMRLVDQGVVDLDRPVLDVLPREGVEEMLGHSLDAPGFRADRFAAITARHILSHSSGLPHGDGGAMTPVFFEPGTDWKYSAEGYGFLRHPVEQLMGKPLDELVRAGVGRPPLGCLELEYQRYDSPSYSVLWAVVDAGAGALAERLPAAVAADPGFLDGDRIAAMAGLLEEEGRLEEAAVLHSFNLERHPQSGAMLINLAQHHLARGDLERADDLLRRSLTVAEPAEPEKVEWIMGYLRAIRDPVRIDEATLAALAGDYGPRHLRLRDGRLYYSRDTVEVSSQRPLHAESANTFVLQGLTSFKLRVVLDESGAPSRLVGLCEGGRQDVAPRNDDASS